MYLEFFGMRELPFTLTPNTDFFIALDGHHQALEVVHLALEGGEGFIKITGEVGTGKTLLCRRLLNTLGEEYVTAYIPNPFLTPDGLMLALAEELELPVEIEKGRHYMLGQINNKLVGLCAFGRGDTMVGPEHVRVEKHYQHLQQQVGYNWQTLVLACVAASAGTLLVAWWLF